MSLLRSDTHTTESEEWTLFISTYPPRECGIATFTQHIVSSFDPESAIQPKVAAITSAGRSSLLPPKTSEVLGYVYEGSTDSFRELAHFVNSHPNISSVVIQHEFGLFGGNAGDVILSFLSLVTVPIVVTFHTTLPQPSEDYLTVLTSVAEYADIVIAQNETMSSLLQSVYSLPQSKIHIIRHGTPTLPSESPQLEKMRLGYEESILLSSFGLLSSSKGIEHVISSLPQLVSDFPNLTYLVLGQTHPNVLRNEGEQYRVMLETLVDDLGLTDHVVFENRYFAEEELLRYLNATDIYVSSSLNPDQIVSGTLSYAAGLHKPIVSTPFLHAQELAEKGLVLLTDYNNPATFSSSIQKLLTDSSLSASIARNAQDYTQTTSWKSAALHYEKILTSLHETTS